jgi:hypothetical protein
LPLLKLYFLGLAAEDLSRFQRVAWGIEGVLGVVEGQLETLHWVELLSSVARA